MRKTMIMMCTIHAILFFFSFAVVGFTSMLLNLIMTAWTYSITLTLREKQMVFYLLVLVIGIAEGVSTLLFEQLGNLQILGKMINVVIYTTVAYFVAKNYYFFRQDGGLHGKMRKAQETTEYLL